MTTADRIKHFHPLAELFPLMEGADFDALAVDIKAHGLREPIVLHDDKILDGRNRYRACEKARVDPVFEEWDCQGSIQAFVVSKNLHRRHLSISQRAMIAARLVTLKRGHVETQRNSDGTNLPPALSASEAGNLLNVERHIVQHAKTVLAGGTIEEIKAVESGEAGASTIARQIRAKTPAAIRAKKRAEPMSQAGKNPERIQRQQLNAEVWGRLRDALTHLTSLPLPAEVAAIARTNDRAGLVDARLKKSTQWLKEFSDAWNAK